MNILQRGWNKVKASAKTVAVCAGMGISALTFSPAAHAAAVIPEILGADTSMADYVTSAITGLGTVVVAVVGGVFAFMLVKKGIRWAKGL